MPFALRHNPNPSNYFTLPGITAAQANRIKARFTEFEAVAQPVAQKKDAATQEQMLARMAETLEAVEATLTPEQKAALPALPPYTEGSELGATLGPVDLHSVHLSPEQAQTIMPGRFRPCRQSRQTPCTRRSAWRPRTVRAIRAGGYGDVTNMRTIQLSMDETSMGIARTLAGLPTDAERIAWMHAR